MFNLLKKFFNVSTDSAISKQSNNPKNRQLYIPYKDNKSLFEMHCKYCKTDIILGNILPALVLPSTENSEYVGKDKEGLQTAILLIASEEGGFSTVAKTAGPGGDRLKIGDLVLWMPMTYLDDESSEYIQDIFGDKRAAWVGLITEKISCHVYKNHDTDEAIFDVICTYRG